MFSLVRFLLWIAFIYLYYQTAEWLWNEFLPALSGAGVLLMSIGVMFFCVIFAQITVWKISDLFVREKYYE
ncbi:hypothetical protein ACFO0S_08005 [Chryseomicrobium palamuruense]|uniref:Uncharacterized protein n=1 Tax=Chryseomicrobium palamuruense TaxID=682973 RepID=A0ABV8UVZ3_9BACL